jgi:hypothetical protein
MMKKTRLLIALLVLFFTASGYAQDSYRETLKEYYKLYGQGHVDTETFKQGCKQSCQYWFKSGDLDLNQLTDRYMEEGLIDFMTDFMLPKMKEMGVTEERMKETISFLSSPEGKTFNAHVQQWYGAIKNELSSIFPDFNIMDGDSNPVQLRKDIDAEYIGKFMEYIGDYTVKSIEPIYDMYSRSITRFGEKLGVKPDEIKEKAKKWENLKAWMTANLPTVAVNSAYGIITMDDLDLAIANKVFADDSAYSKWLSTMNTIDPMQFGLGMMGDYVEWMQKHGAVLRDGAMDGINQVKQMFGD